jgi:glycolate oxidase iron-sulfur subunit
VTSGWLRDRKVGHIRSTGAAIVATANPGCQLLIQQGLAMGAGNGRGHPRVVHPAVLLAEAYRAETAGGGHSGG